MYESMDSFDHSFVQVWQSDDEKIPAVSSY